MADSDFGGHMKLRLADGTNLVMRGQFSVSPSRYSVEAGANDDGSGFRQATPRLPSFEVTLEDNNVDADALMKAPRQDIYITEEFTGISHIFMRGFFSGEPVIDRRTGELTGLTGHGVQYQRIGA